MKRLWNFVGDEDDPFGPGTDLIISLLAVFLVILVITAKSYQSANTKYQELDSMLRKERAKNSELQRQLSAEGSRKLQFPPNIIITASEGYDFPSGSAELSSSLETYISRDIASQIDEKIKEFDVDTVVVIGHTDGQSINSSNSNLDGLIENVAAGGKPVKELRAGSNTDLGLMRALAVVRRLQDIQKQGERFKGLDPRKGFRAYSAGQLILKNGEFAQPNPNPDKERRRIEIRFTKSGGG
jgi:outer membrane protein OmpA-like peptidoglycan-associated protein